MSKIYENVYIGNFIYACGKFIGFKQGNGAVNLYQQTPNDKYVGDLMMSNECKHIIIEFKKDELDIVTEWQKPHRKKLIENLSYECNEKDNYSLDNIASQAHFLGFPNEKFQLTFTSYYHYFSNRSKNEFIEFNMFIESFYENEIKNFDMLFDVNFSKHRIGVNTKDFAEYLGFLNDKSNDGVSGGIGGLMLTTSKKSKEMIIVPFNNIKQLVILLDMPIPKSLSQLVVEEIKQNIKETQVETTLQIRM